ncbi:hypothetical protein V8C40DRAFT_251216 [Trichoderma camerunense]
MAHMQGGSSSLPAQLDRQKSEGEGQSRSYSRSPGKTRPSGEKNPLWMHRLGVPEAVGHSRSATKSFTAGLLIIATMSIRLLTTSTREYV